MILGKRIKKLIVRLIIISVIICSSYVNGRTAQADDFTTEQMSEQAITEAEYTEAKKATTVNRCGLAVEEIYENISEIPECNQIYESGYEYESESESGKNQRIESYYSDNEWDRYKTHYIRNRMTQEPMLEAWNYYDTLFSRYLNGSEDIASLVTPYYFASSVKWSKDDALVFWNAFFYSNPQYYFVKSTFRYSKTSSGYYGVAFEIYPEFASGQKRSETTKNIKSGLDNLCLRVAGNTDYERVCSVYDLICTTLNYKSNVYDQSLYSAVVLKETVCAGYSALFQVLCNYFDIPVVEAVSSTHGWNRVRINGVWYEVDTTNADQDSYINNRFFLRATERIQEIFEFYNVNDSIKNFLPECAADTGSSKNEKGQAAESMGTLEKPQINEGSNGVVTITSAAGEIYYTLDGSQPSPFYKASRLYTGPFTGAKNQTVRAVAVLNGYTDSGDTDYKICHSLKEADNKKYGIIMDYNKPVNIKKTSAADGKIYGTINMIPNQKIQMSEVFGISDEFYKSDNTKIAAVNSSGKITAKKKGSTRIYAFNASGKISGFVDVTVYGVRLNKIYSTSLNSVFYGMDYLELDGYKPDKVSFESRKERVVTVSGNLNTLTTTGNGTSRISAIVDGVPVNSKFISKLPKINKTSLVIKTGKSKKLKVSRTKEGAVFRTVSSDIISVAPLGEYACVVTALKPGNTTVNVFAGGNEFVCDVTVQ